MERRHRREGETERQRIRDRREDMDRQRGERGERGKNACVTALALWGGGVYDKQREKKRKREKERERKRMYGCLCASVLVCV